MYDQPTLARLIEYLEREFRIQYREAAEMVQRPLAERVEEGVAIDGLTVVEHDNAGSQPFTIFETNSVGSKLRTGDYFYCHRADDDVRLRDAMDVFRAIPFDARKIRYMSPDRRDIHLPGDFSDGSIWCIDQLPSERFPLTMFPSLMAGAVDSSCATGEKVRRWLAGEVGSFCVRGVSRRGPRRLTSTQRLALHRALLDEITLIQGPPGTGKTYLIAVIIDQLLRDDPDLRILVTCFSHTAVDNVLWAVYECNPDLPLYRVGRRPEDPELPPDTNDTGEHFFGSTEGVWGMTAFKAARPWTSELGRNFKTVIQAVGDVRVEDRIDAVRQAWQQSTLPGSDDHFDIVIIDEASQMTIPTALMAMVHGKRCILVGDEKQLPPVSQSVPPFAPSIFDHMIDCYEEQRPVMLDVTHRMNEEICLTPSKLFYGGKLVPRDDIRQRRVNYPTPPSAERDRPDWLARALNPEDPVLFLSIEHDTGDEASPEEARVVAEIVAEMLATGLTHDKGIAVVCKHRKQNNLVRRCTKQAIHKLFPGNEINLEGLVSDTVERIQGQERDAIVVSLIGSDPSHLTLQWTFSHCPRRFNVTITRPKTKLIVIGSPNFFHFTPPADDPDALDQLEGISAIKRWYLDRLDRQQIIHISSEEIEALMATA